MLKIIIILSGAVSYDIRSHGGGRAHGTNGRTVPHAHASSTHGHHKNTQTPNFGKRPLLKNGLVERGCCSCGRKRREQQGAHDGQQHGRVWGSTSTDQRRGTTRVGEGSGGAGERERMHTAHQTAEIDAPQRRWPMKSGRGGISSCRCGSISRVRQGERGRQQSGLRA